MKHKDFLQVLGNCPRFEIVFQLVKMPKSNYLRQAMMADGIKRYHLFVYDGGDSFRSVRTRQYYDIGLSYLKFYEYRRRDNK